MIEAHFSDQNGGPKIFRLQNKDWLLREEEQKWNQSYKDQKRQQALNEIEFECGCVLLNININYLIRVFSGTEQPDVLLNISELKKCVEARVLEMVPMPVKPDPDVRL